VQPLAYSIAYPRLFVKVRAQPPRNKLISFPLNQQNPAACLALLAPARLCVEIAGAAAEINKE